MRQRLFSAGQLYRLARLYDQPPICMGQLEGLLPVEQGPRLTVDGDAVPRADEGRTAGSLFGPHVVDTIGGQQGVIQMVAGQQRVHGLGFGGIARRIQGKAIEPEHKADADGGVVVLVAGGHGFDLDITQGASVPYRPWSRASFQVMTAQPGLRAGLSISLWS